jgi:hypothetical protein
MTLREMPSMIRELDSIVLTRELDQHGLKAGDVGTVVLVHRGGEAYEVEFTTLAGETIAVVSLPASQLRPVGSSEIAHARSVSEMPA